MHNRDQSSLTMKEPKKKRKKEKNSSQLVKRKSISVLIDNSELFGESIDISCSIWLFSEFVCSCYYYYDYFFLTHLSFREGASTAVCLRIPYEGMHRRRPILSESFHFYVYYLSKGRKNYLIWFDLLGLFFNIELWVAVWSMNFLLELLIRTFFLLYDALATIHEQRIK